METQSSKAIRTSQSPEFIDFKNIREYINIADHKLFIVYLNEIYYDLSERSLTNKKGISKVTFLDYLKLPVFIGEKLFHSLDLDGDSFLNSFEFVDGLCNLYLGNFEKSIEIIFSIYDFDKDGLIKIDDVRIILSHIPLKDSNFNFTYKYQMESLEEIEDIVSSTFGKQDKLNLKEFIYAIENRKSDVFLQLLCFIYQKKPFFEHNLNKMNLYKKKASYLQNENVNYQNVLINKIIPSPNFKSYLSPFEAFMKFNNVSCWEEEKSSMIDLPPCLGMIRMPNEVLVKKRKSNENIGYDNLSKNSMNIFDSPSTLISKSRRSHNLSDYTISNILTKIRLDDEYEKDEAEYNNFSITTKFITNSVLEYEGWVFKLSESLKMKRYWLVLSGKEIYYYKNPKKEELLLMHNLCGCILKEKGENKIFDTKMFGFSIIVTGKTRNYYCENEASYQMWISNIKESVGYQNFFEYFTVLDDIGEGKFGKVKLGIYKKTNQKVAIKIIKKESLVNSSDIELIKSEIDILKLCKHPNVVRLLDHFENNEYIFIVMEYLRGGHLGGYIERKNFNISEKRAANIMHQLASAVKYLHNFGILHRDLKPENIMLVDASEDAFVKVMDFGLSKIIGPTERLADGFGSLSYVSPEVLIRKPYDKQIDIWSLGIILYHMLSGSLPFDDKDDNEELIANMIVFNEVDFPKNVWNKFSTEVVDLIKKCLVKDPTLRITVESLLNHEWLKNNQ